MSENSPPSNAASPYPRLPCRGCTPDCKNYAVCEGTPWRIDRDGKVQSAQTDTSHS